MIHSSMIHSLVFARRFLPQVFPLIVREPICHPDRGGSPHFQPATHAKRPALGSSFCVRFWEKDRHKISGRKFFHFW
jgi:hypothetical protein